MENIEVWEKVKFTFITISIICFKKGPKKYWIRVTVAAKNAGHAFVAATINISGRGFSPPDIFLFGWREATTGNRSAFAGESHFKKRQHHANSLPTNNEWPATKEGSIERPLKSFVGEPRFTRTSRFFLSLISIPSRVEKSGSKKRGTENSIET